MSQDHAKALLRRYELRCTPGRTAIVRVFLEEGRPLTESDLGRCLSTRHALNKVTIYRALTAFVGADLLHVAYVKDRVTYYELGHRCSDIQCHPHFTCRQCQETFCLPEVHAPLIEPLPPGFELERQKVSLEGLCPRCKKKAEKD